MNVEACSHFSPFMNDEETLDKTFSTDFVNFPVTSYFVTEVLMCQIIGRFVPSLFSFTISAFPGSVCTPSRPHPAPEGWTDAH